MYPTEYQRWWWPLIALTLALAPRAVAQGDSTPPPAIFRTMGQPPRWKPYVGAFVGVNNITTTDRATNVGGFGLVGLYRDLISPLPPRRPPAD
jgi:hypothetical protein